jgi:hypothetical protein
MFDSNTGAGQVLIRSNPTWICGQGSSYSGVLIGDLSPPVNRVKNYSVKSDGSWFCRLGTGFIGVRCLFGR